MPEQPLADVTLGIYAQTSALLFLLSEHGLDTDKYDLCRTFPVYRGREHLIAIQARLRGSQHSIVVIFGEHRSSDDILVEHRTCKYELNPFTSQDFSQEGPSKLFPYGSFRQAEAHIEMLLEKFTDPDQVPVPKVKKSSAKKVKAP